MAHPSASFGFGRSTLTTARSATQNFASSNGLNRDADDDDDYLSDADEAGEEVSNRASVSNVDAQTPGPLLDSNRGVVANSLTLSMSSMALSSKGRATATSELQPQNWVATLTNRPEFVREPEAATCWRAIDPTGSREPEVARSLQSPEAITSESAGAVLSALIRTWIPVPPPATEERLPFAYSLLGLKFDPYASPTQDKIPEVKKAYNRLRAMLASLIMVFEFLALPSHDPTFCRSSSVAQSGTAALTAFHRLSVSLKLAKQLVLNDVRFRALYGTSASSLLSEFAAPWEDYIPSSTGTALLASANESGRGGRGGRGGGRGGGGAGGGAGGNSRMPGFDPRGFQAHQVVIIGVLQDLKKHCLCLMDGDDQGQVWQQVLTSQGKATHAYKPRCKMIDYVREWSAARDNTDRWALLTNSKWDVSKIADHLLVQPFEQFLPRRKMSRSVWSFRNGIYKADDNKFYEYSSTSLPEELVSCKYIDAFLDPDWVTCDDLHSIAFDADGRSLLSSVQILLDQDFTIAEIDEVHGLLGRCYFPIGLYDKMDCMLAFVGQAGTGKSSIVNGLKMLFPKNYVRSFNGKEKTFGLQGCENAWLVVTSEITPDLQNQIGEILMWIAGEPVPIARKNLTQVTAKIKAHLVLCGNSFNLRDVGGNINRRSIVCQFDRKPLVPNTQLKAQQRKEIARFLVYTVRQYHNLHDRVGKDELIRHLQPKFRASRREIISQVNPIISFLHRDEQIFTSPVRAKFMQHIGGQVDTRELPYLPQETFMRLISAHARQWQLDTKVDFNESSFSFAFDEFGLYKLSKATYMWWDEQAFLARAGGQRGSAMVLPVGPPTVKEGSIIVGVGFKIFADLHRTNELAILDAHLPRAASYPGLASASSDPASSLVRSGSYPGALSDAELPVCQPKSR